jgi:tRNA-modifying protein YgfZ
MSTISTITVTGPDAFEFLQGQLSNDLRLLQTTDTILAAWCNPKGRVICLMEVSGIENGYACTVPTDLADEVLRKLTMFRFRSKVEFTLLAEQSSLSEASVFEQGVPFVGRQQSEKFTPHMLNLDLLGAISLDKGCYTGQEIVARTHYKGASKRRMFRFESAQPVATGDKVSAGERDIGEVLYASGKQLLAVVPVDYTTKNLHVGRIELRPLPLPYD